MNFESIEVLIGWYSQETNQVCCRKFHVTRNTWNLEQEIKRLENQWQLLQILKCNRLMQCLLHCSVWCRIVAIKTFTVLYERTDGLALGTLLHIISAELPKFPNNMFFMVVKEVFPHFPCVNHFHNACRKKLYGIQTSTLVGWGFFHSTQCISILPPAHMICRRVELQNLSRWLHTWST